MFNGVNLQRGNVFMLVFVIYIAIEVIVIMSSIIEILEILLSHSPKYNYIFMHLQSVVSKESVEDQLYSEILMDYPLILEEDVYK